MLDLPSASTLARKVIKTGPEQCRQHGPTVTVEPSVVAVTFWMLPAMSVAVITNVTKFEVGAGVGLYDGGVEGRAEGDVDG